MLLVSSLCFSRCDKRWQSGLQAQTVNTGAQWPDGCSATVQHRRSGSAALNGGLTPVVSFKDLASASQQAFAQGGAASNAGRPGGSPSKQVQAAMLCELFAM